MSNIWQFYSFKCSFISIIYVSYIYLYLRDLYLDAEVTTDEVLMLKGSLSPYLDTHNEEESSYVTLSNGPYGKYYNTIEYRISSVTSIAYCIRLIRSLIRHFLVTAYVADSTSTEHNSYNHVLIDVYFVTPILCKHCKYIINYNLYYSLYEPN